MFIHLLKYILFAVFFFITVYSYGKITVKLCGGFIHSSAVYTIAYGFIAYLAVVYLFGWWFVRFSLSAPLFAAFVLLISIAAILWNCIFYRSEFHLNAKGLFRKIQTPAFDMAFLMLLLLILLSIFFERSDADDSFYVSNVAAFSKWNVLNAYDASMGDSSLGTMPLYDFQTWEALMGAFCRVFHIQASVLMHSVLPPLLLSVSCCCYIVLGKSLLNNNKSAAWFWTLIAAFMLFGGNAVFSKGSFMLSRIWQGKAVYLHTVMPLVFAVLIDAYKITLKKKSGFPNDLRPLLPASGLVLLGNIAGISLNPTALYTVGALTFFLGISVVIGKRSIRHILAIVPALFILLIFAVLLYFNISKNPAQIDVITNGGENIIGYIFKNFWGSGISYIFVFFAALAVILFFGNSVGRIAFLLTPALLFLCVWNPVCGEIIARHVTSVATYWRVFWLIPVETAIAYAVLILAKKFKSVPIRSLLLILGILAVTVPGKFMFTAENNFVKTTNAEHLPAAAIEFGKQISDAKGSRTVLACYEISTTIRQEYTDIELICSREGYLQELLTAQGRTQELEERLRLFRFVCGNIDETDVAGIKEYLEKYNVGWIILKNDNTAAIDSIRQSLTVTASTNGEYTAFRLE